MPWWMATASAIRNSAQSSRNAEPSQSHEGFVLVLVSPSGVGPRPHVRVLLWRPASVSARSAPSAQSLSDPQSITWFDAGMVGSLFFALLYPPSMVLTHSN